MPASGRPAVSIEIWSNKQLRDTNKSIGTGEVAAPYVSVLQPGDTVRLRGRWAGRQAPSGYTADRLASRGCSFWREFQSGRDPLHAAVLSTGGSHMVFSTGASK